MKYRTLARVVPNPLSPKRLELKEASMRKNLTTLFISLLVLSGGFALLSGCNTTSGAGKDVSSVGRAITEGAEGAK